MNKFLFLSVLILLANSSTEALSAGFSNNNVNSSNTIYGGIYNNSSNAELSDVDFTNNQVTSDHGGVTGGMINNEGYISLTNAKFSDNEVRSLYSDVTGGVINNKGNASLANTSFKNNHVSSSQGQVTGGIIYNEGENLTISDSTFETNYVSSANGGVTGGMINNTKNASLTNVDFIDNQVESKGVLGGMVYNEGNISLENADFSRNNIKSTSGLLLGGGIYNDGYASLTNVDFTNNYVSTANGQILGGMMYNGGETVLNDVTFTNSYVSAANDNVMGGIIANGGEATLNNVTFENNYVSSANGGVMGGMIYNEGNVSLADDTTFKNNYISAAESVDGGIIANGGGTTTLSNVNFTNNYVSSANGIAGGMIENIGEATLNTVTFENNYVKSDASGYETGITGGMIANAQGTTSLDNVTFKNNYVSSANIVNSGMIYNLGDTSLSNTTFENNYISAVEAVEGGMIYNLGDTSLSNTTFENNYISATNVVVMGGMIVNENGTTTLNNVTFENNHIGSANGVAGGAIFNTGTLNITADGEGKESIFKNNIHGEVRGGAIFSEGGSINLEAKNGGNVVFYDDIDGNGNYELTIAGDTTEIAGNDGKMLENKNAGEIYFLNNVNGAKTLNLNKGGIMHLGKDAEVNVADYIGGGVMKVDVDVNDANQTVQSGLLNVANSISGKTDVIVNSLNQNSFRDAATQFISANNTETPEDAFRVAAVYGSPYAWNAKMNIKESDTGSQWYLVQDVDSPLEAPEEEKPDDNSSTAYYQPEVAAYVGLQRAAVEQNRSLGHSIKRGLAFKGNRICTGEGCVEDPLLPKQEFWTHASYESASVDAPSEFDADIKGLTAGVDLMRDYDQRAGIFAAYRTGDYDFNGKGDYRSRYSSDVDIKSYTGGLYYHYNKNNWVALATAFIGTQDIDVKAKSSYTNGSTDAMQYGASAEIARRFAYGDHLNFEPSLGLYYTALDIDKLNDNMGKTVEFDMLHYLEAELGLKVEYQFCRGTCANYIYVKPSVIKTFANNAKTQISGLRSVKSYDDELLARLEVGGDFGLTEKVSGYLTGGYTFGDDYDAYDVNVGARYAF